MVVQAVVDVVEMLDIQMVLLAQEFLDKEIMALMD
jgi:hypothetical protein